jgi:hypothetical protein
MTGWEKKIVNAFIDHYFASVPETGENRSCLRIRSSLFFPDFDTARPDEKESYLEAAESLERKGVITVKWEKRGRGERLKTISCEHFEKLFEEANRPYPQTEAEEIRATIAAKAAAKAGTHGESAGQIAVLLEHLSRHFGPREIGRGMDRQTTEDFIRLLEFLLEGSREKMTVRALSVLLYRDSKRLETILDLCAPLIARLQKTVPVPDLSFLERSYPETYIAGKIIIEFKNSKPPMVNSGGHILNLPLETAEEIESIQPVSEKKEKSVLTIENKETFFALGSPQKHYAKQTHGVSCVDEQSYDCFLYAGGYSNRATAVLVKTLAASGFSFHHAGDLDPDGILILQHIQDIAGKPVTPFRMDAETFDRYRPWARPLPKTVLRQIEKIREETRAVPALSGLLRRVEETGMGVEQEIIDYR